jgi:hypothetical protein
MRRTALVLLHLIIGIGGIAAGASFTLEPSGADIGMDVAFLDGSPFPDYRVPGLFLLLLIGPANLVSAAAHLRRNRFADVLSLLTGIVLLVWITVQWSIIGYQHWTQIGWTLTFITVTLMGAKGVQGSVTESRGGNKSRYQSRGAREALP